MNIETANKNSAIAAEIMMINSDFWNAKLINDPVIAAMNGVTRGKIRIKRNLEIYNKDKG